MEELVNALEAVLGEFEEVVVGVEDVPVDTEVVETLCADCVTTNATPLMATRTITTAAIVTDFEIALEFK